MSVDYNSYLPRNVLAVQYTLVNNGCLKKDISYKNRLTGTKRRYQGVPTPNSGLMADQRQRRRVSFRGVQDTSVEIGGRCIEESTADCFRHCFPPRPRIEKGKIGLRIRQTRFPSRLSRAAMSTFSRMRSMSTPTGTPRVTATIAQDPECDRLNSTPPSSISAGFPFGPKVNRMSAAGMPVDCDRMMRSADRARIQRLRSGSNRKRAARISSSGDRMVSPSLSSGISQTSASHA